MTTESTQIPEAFLLQRWVLDYDPNRPAPFWVRLPASETVELDMKPIRVTTDRIGTGTSFQEALDMAQGAIPALRTAVFRSIAKRWPRSEPTDLRR